MQRGSKDASTSLNCLKIFMTKANHIKEVHYLDMLSSFYRSDVVVVVVPPASCEHEELLLQEQDEGATASEEDGRGVG